MPRSGWLAVGAALAAATWKLLGPGPGLAIVAVAVALVMAVAGLGRRFELDPSWRRALRVIAVGIVVVGARSWIGAHDDASVPAALPADSPGVLRAVVESLSSPRNGAQLATLRLTDTNNIRVAATLARYPPITPGDVVLVEGPVRGLGDDEYGRFLGQSGIAGTLLSRRLEVLPSPLNPTTLLERVRRGSADALALALPEPEAGLAAGILIGLRDRVDRELASAFTQAGVSHVVAISGWNIAIVGATIAALCRSWTRRRRSVATVLAVVGYAAFAGASPSVVRAAAMALVVLLARESGRAGSAAAALGWAVTAMLLVEPSLAIDPGFEMSSVATAGLIAWATPLTDRLRAWHQGVLPGWLSESLGVSLAAQTATLPIVLVAFGRLSLVAPLANLAVVPLVPPAMVAGLLALGAGGLQATGIPLPIGPVFGFPGWLCLATIVWLVRAASTVPFASVTVEPPLNLILAFGCCLVATTTAFQGRWGRALRAGARALAPKATRAASSPRPPTRIRHVGRAERLIALGLAVSVGAVVVAAAGRPDGQVRIAVLDVGQGDAILVEGGRGGRMLVDGGPDPDRLLVALDGRLPPWDRRIDLLVLTHPHEDHVGGLALLLARYHVGRVFEPGMVGPGPGYAAWSRELAAVGRRSETLATGDHFGLDGIRFSVLWPDAGTVPREAPNGGTAINNVSIVLLGQTATQRFLLAGDIEEQIDPILLARGLPRIDLLKVAHHGSRTSSTQAFLDRVRPTVAVVSVGKGNRYGHPAPATLERLAAHGARVFRTDENGTTEIVLDGRRVTATAQRVAASREIRLPSVNLGPNLAPEQARGAYVRGRQPYLGRFACSIPIQAYRAGEAFGASSTPGASSNRAPGDLAGPSAGSIDVLYHRLDVGPPAGRGRRAPPFPRSAAMVPAPCTCGGGSGRVARGAHCPSRDSGRSRSGRGSGAAPRCGQAAAVYRSCARPPPRRGIGSLAGPSGPPGAGSCRCGPSRHQAP